MGKIIAGANTKLPVGLRRFVDRKLVILKALLCRKFIRKLPLCMYLRDITRHFQATVFAGVKYLLLS